MKQRNKFITVRVNPSEEEKLDAIIFFLNDIMKEVVKREGLRDVQISDITRSQFIRGFTNWIFECGYIDRDMWIEWCCYYVREKVKPKSPIYA